MYLQLCPISAMCMQRYQSRLSGRLSACVQVSQLGAMAAPALMMLTQLPSAASVPFFVWGPTAIGAGLLLWLLPDTLGASIPASVQVRPCQLAAFCPPQSQALTCRTWTYSQAVKPVCAMRSLCTMSAESGCCLLGYWILFHSTQSPFH